MSVVSMQANVTVPHLMDFCSHLITPRTFIDSALIASQYQSDNSFENSSSTSSEQHFIEMPSSPSEFSQYNFDKSIEIADDQHIQPIAETITVLLSISMPNLLTIIPETGEMALTDEGVTMSAKVKHFFQFVRQYSKLTIGELLHITVLLTRLLSNEAELIRDGKVSIVSEANLGTLLLCSTLIAVKMERDIPYRNSWWAKMFGVPLHILNQSERIFLQKIDYNCTVSDGEFLDMYQKFIMNTDTPDE
ncbi:uncharacterized protein MONOS_10404 [Monocercomonoides exilis]|uniref:uncharacterized protein n=1 Tax=Monocercomonoides exilis TaxID=2049356 RepID=UPI00355A8E3F|nr:hypothetical protein MONOS_10404 [Monocercomonoides exilis]|eukprot:MONOS_10404.1-p1 / transcript=MONOS_10404.1 / gene=MONOS_10404 / organism=Monocercomonoides_exilis_PA203 / gene_product=unspecified product / transcript_product=unspecified product / location=Mono_scaffold00472:45652-46493(+) / protein_length=247 / sequence_SO=supercontig / SO=protein_coding / is_pseudo=false